MPLPGFNELKKRNKEQHWLSADVLGEEVVYYRVIGGSPLRLLVHIDRQNNADTEEHTILQVDRLSVQIMKEDLDCADPVIGDKLTYEGKTYACTGDILEQGTSWVRVVFTNEHLQAKGITSAANRTR